MTSSTVPFSRRFATSWPVALFVLSAVGLLLTDVDGMRVAPALFRHPFGFFDLKIYRESAGVMLSGHALYAAKFQLGFGFTYPPFAALMFIGLRALPVGLDEIVVSAMNLALVLVIARLTIDISGGHAAPQSADRQRRRTWVIAALALWIEPVVTAMSYGQIDLLVAALVWFDLVRGRDSRWGGAGIGLAAALKLTPLVFIPYLALTGRWRAVRCALGTVVASIALSFAIAPRDAWAYWGRAIFDTGRVTGHRPFAGRGPANQSLRGMLLRLAGGDPHITVIWVAVCLIVGVGGLWLALRAHRRENEALAGVLVAITGLLICPVSWTHHWVIATPGLVLLARSGRGVVRACATGLALGLAAVSPVLWVVITNHPNGANLQFGQFVLGDLYVITGLLTLGGVATVELARMLAPGLRGRRPSRRKRDRAGRFPGFAPGRWQVSVGLLRLEDTAELGPPVKDF